DDEGACAAREKRRADGGRDAPGAGAESLPVRDPHADFASGAPGCGGHGWGTQGPGGAGGRRPDRGGDASVTAFAASRRAVLRGGGLVVAFAIAPRLLAQEQGGPPVSGSGPPGDLSKHPLLD